MNAIKAVKALVAENDALKAEIEELKNARCEKCALEEKIKGLLAQCRELTTMVSLDHHASKATKNDVLDTVQNADDCINSTWQQANEKLAAIDRAQKLYGFLTRRI